MSEKFEERACDGEDTSKHRYELAGSEKKPRGQIYNLLDIAPEK
jgi:hypothetical protein